MLREELACGMSGVAKMVVYEDSEPVVSCAVEVTDGFKPGLGLHQGLALRPFFWQW